MSSLSGFYIYAYLRRTFLEPRVGVSPYVARALKIPHVTVSLGIHPHDEPTFKTVTSFLSIKIFHAYFDLTNNPEELGQNLVVYKK